MKNFRTYFRIISIVLMAVAGSLGAKAEVTYIDGFKYEYFSKGTASLQGVPEDIAGDVVIPATITVNDNTYYVSIIGNDCFNGKTEVTSVTLNSTEDHEVELARRVFQNCTSLKFVDLPYINYMSDDVFDGCETLKSVILRDNRIPEVDNYSDKFDLSNATLYVIDNLVGDYKASEEGSFWLRFGDIKPVSEYNNGGDDNDDDNEYEENNLIFTYDTNTNEATLIKVNDEIAGDVTVPATISIESIVYNVTFIADRCFEGQTAITSVTINGNESITLAIGSQVFLNCSALLNVDLPDNISLYDNIFDGCTSLEYAIVRAKSLPDVNYMEGNSSDLSNATLYVEDEIMSDYANSEPNSFWHMFGEIKALSSFGQASGSVRLTFAGATFEFPHMANGHQIIVTLPENHAISESTNGSYTVEANNTITINNAGGANIEIIPVDDQTSAVVSIQPESLEPWIEANGDEIIIKGLDAEDIVSIADNAGRLLYTGTERQFKLPAGIFLVSTPFNTCKLRINARY